MGPDEKTGVGTALEAATVLVMGPEAVMMSKLVEGSIGAARATGRKTSVSYAREHAGGHARTASRGDGEEDEVTEVHHLAKESEGSVWIRENDA